jgi:hypothetical protein
MKPLVRTVRACSAARSPCCTRVAAGRGDDRRRHGAADASRSERHAFDAAARGRRTPALRNVTPQPHSVIRDAGSGFTASARRAACCAATTAMTRFTRSAA